MKFELRFTPTALAQLGALRSDPKMKGTLGQVRKTLGYLETNLKSRSLQTHKYESLSKIFGREVFEAYAQNKTSGAYRVFWHYGNDEVDGEGKRVPIITVVSITPHP